MKIRFNQGEITRKQQRNNKETTRKQQGNNKEMGIWIDHLSQSNSK
jgi:hypothetical protein